MRVQSLGNPGEIDDVDKHHGNIGKTIGNGLAAVLQALGNRAGENVQQQAFGAILLVLQHLVRFFEAHLGFLFFDGRIAEQ